MPRNHVVAALVPCLLGVLMTAGAPPAAQAAEALVIGQVGYIREATDLAVEAVVAVLQSEGHLVTQRNPHLGDSLADMDSFDCVWDIRSDFGWTTTNASLFENYLREGGNLYFAGEHAAFAFRNDAVVNLVTTLGGGVIELSTVVPPGATGVDVVEATNPAQPLTYECNAVSEVDYDGVGSGTFLATGTGDWITGEPDAAAAAVWGPGSMPEAPNATVVAILDINWMYEGLNGTLFWRVDDPTVPTENLAFLSNLVKGLCAVPACRGGCTPRNHGFWHRYCLGAGEIDPGRHGGGRGPGVQGRHADLPSGLLAAADAAMASHGLTACQALDEGPFSDPRLAALRELATMELNLAAGLLKRSCAVELRPVVDADDLTVADAISHVLTRLADGSPEALREARWIGEHVVNGEALVRDR